MSLVALASLTVLLMSAAPASPPAMPPSPRQIASAADRYLTARTELGGFSGAVLIARHGQVLFRKGFGWADIERRVRFSPETPHEVASVSKMFTAMAALELQEAGKLTLDQPICNLLEECPNAWRAVTVSQLIHHTSGIPDYEERLGLGSAPYLEFMGRAQATADLIENARRDTLEFEPGSQFHYSNTGYLVLARIIERIAGRPFADHVRQTLLEPAGMRSSGAVSQWTPGRDLAVGYTRGDVGWDTLLSGIPLERSGVVRVPRLPLAGTAGDGFLFSTVDDLLRWSRIMAGDDSARTDPVVSRSLATAAWTAGLGGYGAGWFVDEKFGRRRLSHTGFLPGHATNLVVFPDDGVTIVLCSNFDRIRIDRITRDLSAIALGQPCDLPVRGHVAKLAAGQLERLEGKYQMSDGAILTVRNEPDHLTAEWPKQFVAGLIPLSPTEFFMPMTEGRVTFDRIGATGAGRLNLRYSGVDHIGIRAPD
ncbi:MAG: beta-lactamase family protein [Candidatus Eisenbacteria bacterium]|uniref:Beta-lactamase family protein n=1 Tax=Eiseniibacteriota bacterium TaxID=2212470 RepID=A0A849SH62_UNCEI|nr:beta-lactamase family protein [Candidatus Eisenbacteria bacterium]